MQFAARKKIYDDTDTLSGTDLICYCVEVDKKTILEAIQDGAETLKEINQLLKSNSRKTMKKNVFKTTDGVKISFSGAVEKQNIVRMVENCQTGQCECMSDETKAKVKGMNVSGTDGNVSLDLSGEVSKEEIEAALARSKVINSD